MAHPQRMDEMGLRAASRDLDACRMSKEVLPNEEVAIRVRVAISGAFQVEDVNAFPMKLEMGCLNVVSISSLPSLKLWYLLTLTNTIWILGCHPQHGARVYKGIYEYGGSLENNLFYLQAHRYNTSL